MSTNLWSAFVRTAERQPQAVAIVQGEQRITYAEWQMRARTIAAALRRRGVGRYDRLIVAVDASPEVACAITGAWMIGAIPVFVAPSAGPEHFSHVIDRTAPKLLLRSAEDDCAGASNVEPATLPELSGIEPESAAAPVLPTDPASILFTSGSTGKPKGVTQSHGSLLRACHAVGGYLGLSPAQRILCTVPWSFDYGYGQLLSTIVIGVPQVLPSVMSPFGICEAIERDRPSVVAGIPSVFANLLRGVSPFSQTDVSSIAVVTNTGGTIAEPVFRDLMKALPDRRIFLNYGLTESYRTSFLDPALVERFPDSIGGPVPGVDIAVVREDGSLADAGEEGEIVHRGDYLFSGYWGDREATDKALRPDPFAPPGHPNPSRVLFTGDFGRIETNGLLYFHGRRDHMLKSMGVRVSPGEVERLLYMSDLVKEVAVFGVKHDLIGDEIWAAVVPSGTVEELQRKLTDYAKRAMSRYEMPRRYLMRTELPKTASGKIDYERLRAEAGMQRSVSLT